MEDILSETELRDLSKQLSSIILKRDGFLEDTDFQHLEQVLSRIIHTVASAKLSLSHGTAAWNSLSGFLDLGVLSSDARLRDVCFASRTWLEMFELFLSRSQNAKAKPMKQFLRTLTNLLLKQPNAAVKESLKKHAVVSAVGMIYEESGFFLVKPAFQVLEHFLHREVIEPSAIVGEMGKKYGFRKETKTVNVSREESRIFNSKSLSPVESASMAEAFMSCVLEWLKYPDIAPIAGRLLLSFFKRTLVHPVENAHPNYPEYELPLWVTPLRDFIQKEPTFLEICETQVMPGLLGLSPTDTQAFLDGLPLKNLREGNTGCHDVIEVQLCLAALRICEEKNKCKDHARKYNENDVQCIAFGLLAHPSSTIRIAALSLVTSTTSFKSPISIQTLTNLQQSIPFFHAEVNPKVRNEFIVLIERLCEKLARAFSIIHTSHFPDQGIRSALHNEERKENAVDELVKKQTAFSKWYMRYLVEELQPAASYQRHISALKILDTLLQIAMNGGGSKKLFDPVAIVDEDFYSNHRQFYGYRCVRLLSDLIMDSFDDVRLVASSILRILLRNMHPLEMDFRLGHTAPPINSKVYALRTFPLQTYNIYIFHTLRRAEEIMYLTGRADHADGVGRLYSMLHDSCKELGEPALWFHNGWSIFDHLLSALENDIEIAKNDIRLAAKTAPLHGKLLALRYIISSKGFYETLDPSDPAWRARRSVNARILSCCAETWEVVREILCFDSPEGSEEPEESEGTDLGNGIKDTSSFCWRALKESSSLMNFMVTNNRYSTSNSDSGFRYEDFQKIGILAFTQLAELRHRGAFSAVSQTFSACCRKCVQAEQSPDRLIKDSLIPHLPIDWYQNALKIIEENASALTRRSAGIPAIITGILNAVPSGKFFDNAILDLQAIADAPVEMFEDFQDLRLPQVHALNCLKDIFTDALLGTASEPHIADSLEIAVDCLESKVWAIRNCGLMLFKALLSRLNGGTDTASSRASSSHRRFSRLAYEKYPNLSNLILKLLSGNIRMSFNGPQNDEVKALSFSLQAQKVYPALEIVGRLGLPSHQRAEIREAIRFHMEGPIWAIREKAAKASALVLKESDFVNEIKQLLEPDERSQNALHGKLLYVRFIIARLVAKTDKGQREAILLLVLGFFERFASQNNCPFTVAAYVNILADGLEYLVKHEIKTATEHAISVQVVLQQISLDGFAVSSGGKLLNGPSSALLGPTLNRCLALIDHARDSSQVDPSLTALGTLPNVMFNKEPISERNLEIVTEFDGLLESSQQRFLQENPQQIDDQLRLTGSMLGSAYEKEPGDCSIRGALAVWSRKLSLAVDEHSDLATRLAAVDSVIGFITTLRNNGFDGWAAQDLLSVYLALYDMLLDDDEDVRDRGAIAASNLLSASAKHENGGDILLMPCATSSRLLQYLVTQYQNSATLWSNAVYRLTGAASSFNLGLVEAASQYSHCETDKVSAPERMKMEALIQLRPLRAMLRDAMQQDTKLFTEEKQNLFINPVKETKNWTEAVLNLHPSLFGRNIVHGFGTWCTEGLVALVEIIESREDGPLGWTSKADVFALGIRILAAVRVRIHCLSGGKCKEERSRYLELLRKMILVGKEKMLHGLWLQYVEEILREVS